MRRIFALALLLGSVGCGGSSNEGLAIKFTGAWSFTVSGVCDGGTLSLTQVEYADWSRFPDSIWGSWACGAESTRVARVTPFNDGSIWMDLFKTAERTAPYSYAYVFVGTWTSDGITASDDAGVVFSASRISGS